MDDKRIINDLRNMLGVLGVLLPVLSLAFNLIFGRDFNPSYVLSSISALHYSSAYLLFEGLVFGMGLFLLCYRGYDSTDRISSIIAGSGALVLALFPVSHPNTVTRNFLMLPQEVTNVFHFIGALSFFGALIYIILFQFPKSSEKTIDKDSRKYKRNTLYKVCGCVMVISLILGFGLPVFFNWRYFVFVGESIALWAFGIAWLTKGGKILRDL